MNCVSMFLFSAWICGVPTVVDGDTIKIGRETIRLWGVDAEEMSEPNGPRAKDILASIVSGKPVKCENMARDKHGRVVGYCFTGTTNINRQVVAQGGALDCRRFSDGAFASVEPVGIRTKLRQKPYC